jgi:hypothetical protein
MIRAVLNMKQIQLQERKTEEKSTDKSLNP